MPFIGRWLGFNGSRTPWIGATLPLDVRARLRCHGGHRCFATRASCCARKRGGLRPTARGGDGSSWLQLAGSRGREGRPKHADGVNSRTAARTRVSGGEEEEEQGKGEADARDPLALSWPRGRARPTWAEWAAAGKDV